MYYTYLLTAYDKLPKPLRVQWPGVFSIATNDFRPVADQRPCGSRGRDEGMRLELPYYPDEISFPLVSQGTR